MTIDEIRDNFALLDEWDDRYRYVIELGRTLAPMSEADHSSANKVQGCTSQVWLARTLARDNRIPVIVFSIRQPGAFVDILRGAGRATIVADA